MLMQHHEAGQHGLAGEIDDVRADRRSKLAARSDGGDATVADDDGLILAGRRAAAINEFRVGEGNERRAERNEGIGVLRREARCDRQGE